MHSENSECWPNMKNVGYLLATVANGNKARAGFEPANDGFANHCLNQLGDRAIQAVLYYAIHVQVR